MSGAIVDASTSVGRQEASRTRGVAAHKLPKMSLSATDQQRLSKVPNRSAAEELASLKKSLSTVEQQQQALTKRITQVQAELGVCAGAEAKAGVSEIDTDQWQAQAVRGDGNHVARAYEEGEPQTAEVGGDGQLQDDKRQNGQKNGGQDTFGSFLSAIVHGPDLNKGARPQSVEANVSGVGRVPNPGEQPQSEVADADEAGRDAQPHEGTSKPGKREKSGGPLSELFCMAPRHGGKEAPDGLWKALGSIFTLPDGAKKGPSSKPDRGESAPASSSGTLAEEVGLGKRVSEGEAGQREASNRVGESDEAEDKDESSPEAPPPPPWTTIPEPPVERVPSPTRREARGSPCRRTPPPAPPPPPPPPLAEPPEIQAGTPACYLLFNEASGGAFLTHWSKEPVVGALCAFFPSKQVPGFKFTTKGGLSEQCRGVSGPNKKRFYAGWASFIRTAHSHSGVLVFYGNVTSTPIAIYLCQSDTTVLKVPLNVPVNLAHTHAVAVIPMSNSGLNVHNMPPRMFTSVGEREGAATSLDGGGDGSAEEVKPLSPRPSVVGTVGDSPGSGDHSSRGSPLAVRPAAVGKRSSSMQERIDDGMRV